VLCSSGGERPPLELSEAHDDARPATGKGEDQTRYRRHHRIDVGVADRNGGNDSVSTVAHDVTRTIASQSHGGACRPCSSHCRYCSTFEALTDRRRR